MSTICWGLHDLAEIGAAFVAAQQAQHPYRSGESDLIRRISKCLVEYHIANAQAYCARYQERADKISGYSQEEIAGLISVYLPKATQCPRTAIKSVAGTIGLLEYNLDDCATVEALTAIVEIQNACMAFLLAE